MTTEVAAQADFSQIRYAQCWEDADVLLAGLDVQPGDVCLSIASAGDNALALLTRNPARVIALDLSPAQLACLEVRIAAYRRLEHCELLELIGSVSSTRRKHLYRRLRDDLSVTARAFWDARPSLIARGIGDAGKFERYFRLFRRAVLPLIHSRPLIKELLRSGSPAQRERFYCKQWDNWRWQLLFRVFFSRRLMGLLGRDPSFFRYVTGNVSERILQRTRHALTVLDPAENPYLQWILTGHHPTALPLALRPEHFASIRTNLPRLEWHRSSLEEFLDLSAGETLDRCNLSDIFEYISEENYSRLLTKLVDRMRPGGRLAYWNMLVPRRRPESLASRLRPLTKLAQELHWQDKAFFYSALVIEEALP
jgi:S-adenosylmethionine-diacylglycerol 3-amino-3-carboxypropyl transferase